MALFGVQPVVEDNHAKFNCTPPSGENIARYIWKLNGTELQVNTSQYTYVAKRINNGHILSCAGVTDRGIFSQESTVTLEVYCKLIFTVLYYINRIVEF